MKLTLLLSSTLTLAAGLSGCGPQEGQALAGTPPAAQEPAPVVATAAKEAATPVAPAATTTRGSATPAGVQAHGKPAVAKASATPAAIEPGPGAPPDPAAPDKPKHKAEVAGQPGVITAVEPTYRQKPASGAGAVLGGVLGGVLGNQVGKGDGRKVATVVGAVGGAAVGHRIEKDRNREVSGYRIEVQLDGGGTVNIERASAQGLEPGQRVRVHDGQLLAPAG
jgi:outer membrane lipoprotein SlyB